MPLRGTDAPAWGQRHRAAALLPELVLHYVESLFADHRFMSCCYCNFMQLGSGTVYEPSSLMGRVPVVRR